jgi:histidinol-phosphate aminotransferase
VLKHALMAHLGVDAAQLTLGNGSNDVLDLVARVAIQPGYNAVVAEHSFVVYRLSVIAAGGELVTVPAKDFGADLPGMLDAIDESTRVVFLANPNNPTGTWVTKDALAGFLDAVPRRVWVVVDEAYFEFAEAPDYPDAISLLPHHPNLIVTRTFSKIHALAALRAGYGVSSPEFADLLNRARQPFNMNSLALAAATQALSDQEFVTESLAINRAGKQQFIEGVRALGLDHIPSLGNFLSIDCQRDATPLFEALLQHGVIVRPIAEYGLPNHLRVSIGLEHENARFLQAFRQVLDGG